MPIIKSLLSLLSPKRRESKVFIDASRYHPANIRSGETHILIARNEAGGIFERVRKALRSAAAVVVIDDGSSDGTPYAAAEAGAVVVLREAGQTREDALAKAVQVARGMTQHGESISIIN